MAQNDEKELNEKKHVLTTEMKKERVKEGKYRKYDPNYITNTFLTPKEWSDDVTARAKALGITKSNYIMQAVERFKNKTITEDEFLQTLEETNNKIDNLTDLCNKILKLVSRLE